MELIEGYEARQRKFKKDFLDEEVTRIKRDVKRFVICKYYDEYDIGEKLLQELLGDDYVVIFDSAHDYSMYSITKIQ